MPLESMESIAEMIGESSSTGKIPKVSQTSTLFSALLAKRPIDKDPLSLISVYAKKNSTVPKQERVRGIGRKRPHQRQRSRTHGTSESIIEEDYPEDFEESVPKTGSTIEEDLPASSSSKQI